MDWYVEMRKQKGKFLFRIVFYIFGLLLLALGITLNTRTNLGVSPLISVAFCVSKLMDTNIGDMTFIWYMVMVVIEILCHIKIKRYKVIVADILQIPLSIVFTRFMNLFSELIPNMTGSILIRLLFLLLAIVLTGVGMAFSLNMRIIPNPGDGIVQVISDCSGKKVSTVKNILDAVCVVMTTVISFVFTGKIIGIGVGTILAVLFVGRVVAVFNHLFRSKIIMLSGLEE